MWRWIVGFSLIFAGAAQAQTRTPSHCLAFADNGARVHRAALKQDEIAITYADHSMYVIDTVGGLRAVTDYNGYIGLVDKSPDIVTMNKGHSSH